MRLLSSHRRKRRTILCAYRARLTTKGAHAPRLTVFELIRPTIIHARVWRWRRSHHLACWLRTLSSVSYKYGVLSMGSSWNGQLREDPSSHGGRSRREHTKILLLSYG